MYFGIPALIKIPALIDLCTCQSFRIVTPCTRCSVSFCTAKLCPFLLVVVPAQVEDPTDTPDSKGLKREISWNTWKKPEDEDEAGASAEGNAAEEPNKKEATKDPPGSPPEEGEAEQEAPKSASKDTKDQAAKSEAAKDGDGKGSASKSKGGSKESSKDRERGRSSGSRRRSRSRSRSRSRGDRGRDRSRDRRDRSRDRRDRSRDRDRRRGSPIIRRDGRPVSPPAPRRRPDEPGPIFTRLQRGGRGGHAAWEGGPRGAPGGAFGGWDERRGAPGMGPPLPRRGWRCRRPPRVAASRWKQPREVQPPPTEVDVSSWSLHADAQGTDARSPPPPLYPAVPTPTPGCGTGFKTLMSTLNSVFSSAEYVFFPASDGDHFLPIL